MSPEDLTALQASSLHRRTPLLITHVRETQFSIARFYGGCTYGGEQYTYHPEDDTLVRWDVDQWLARRRTAQQASARKRAQQAQISLI